MRLRKFALSLAILGFFYGYICGETYLLRVHNPTIDVLQQMISEGKDIAAYEPGVSLDIVASDLEYAEFRNQRLSFEVLETATEIDQRLRDEQGVMQGYRSYEDMVAELKKLAQDYPEICKLTDIADSQGKIYYAGGATAYADYNHDIWAMKVSDNVNEDEDEPKVIYMGEHHAREAASMEVCMAILNHFVKKYGSNDEVTKLVNNCQIWIVPLVNPNGHKIALDGMNKMWRKNARDNNNDKKISNGSGGNTPDGVDLNRNYGFKWGYDNSGSSSSPGRETYRGPSAFSEPEVKAMKDLFDEHRFYACLTYHLYSELVLWSYGYASAARAPDEAALSDLGKKVARLLKKKNGGTYKPQKASDLYPANGVTDDYAYGQMGTFSYTIELYSGTFWPPAGDLPALCEDNLDAAMLLADRIFHSTLTGHLTEKDTKKPLEGVIYVKEIDDTTANGTKYRAPYKSNKKFGTYYRLLMPGKYTVTFSAPGVNDTTFKNVEIFSDKVTTLDVAWGGNTSLFYQHTSGYSPNGLYVNSLENGLVNIHVPSGSGITQVSIFSLNGKLIESFKGLDTRQNWVQWDTSNLPNGMYFIKTWIKGISAEPIRYVKNN